MAASPFSFAQLKGPKGQPIDVRGEGGAIRFPVVPASTDAGVGQPSFSFLGDIGDFFAGQIGDAVRDRFGEQAAGFFPGDPNQCPPGRIRVGNSCIDPAAALPGGVPFITPTGGAELNGSGSPAVVGAFGVPAREPVVVAQPTRRCPRGMVLGQDLLCYMKGTIPMKFRRWKPGPKPPMSAADAKALRRIGSLQSKVKRLAKSANLTCKRK